MKRQRKGKWEGGKVREEREKEGEEDEEDKESLGRSDTFPLRFSVFPPTSSFTV